MTKLTDQQRQLAEDNHNLIYSFLHQHHLPTDDYYGLAATGLCRATQDFNPDMGCVFSTFAYRCMMSEFLHHKRNQHTQKRKPKLADISLSETLREGGELGEFISDGRYSPEDAALVIDLLNLIEGLSPRVKTTLKLLLFGYSQKEAAKIMGVNPPAVSFNFNRARKAIKKEIENG